jgi:tetratricopeptide (TPR) repeat protein
MRDTLDPAAIGRRLRRLRVERGLRQTALASPHYSAAYVSHLEHGRRSPSDTALNRFADRLGVASDYLVTGRDPDLELKLQLACDRAIARIHLGELQSAGHDLQTTGRAAKKEGLPRVQAIAEEGLATIAQKEARYNDALAHLAAATELLAGAAAETFTPIVTARARCFFSMNQLSLAIHVLEKHLVELNDPGPPDPTALLQTYSAMIGPYFEAGLRDQAAVVAEKAHSLEARVQDPEHLACLHINRAQILLEKGHTTEALLSLAKAEDLYRRIGWRDSVSKAAIARASAAVGLGDLETGETQARAALAELDHMPNTLERARVLNLLARICRLRKDPRAALTYLEQTGELLGTERSLEQAWRLRETGLSHLDLGELEGAEEGFRAALEIYKEAETPSQVATTAAYLGDVLNKLGRHEESADVYRAGLAQVEDLAV